MKKISLIFLALLVSATAFSQVGLKAPALKQYYAGGLYGGSAKNYNDIENHFSARFGGIFDVPFPGRISLSAKLIWENGFKSDVRLVKQYLSLKLSVGSMPTITRMFNTPNPVSAGGHFLPPALAAISPGLRPGIMLDNDFLFLGAYFYKSETETTGDSLQFHIGVKAVDREAGFIRKIKVSGYTSNHNAEEGQPLIGGGASLETEKFSTTIFSEYGKSWAYSGFLRMKLYRGWDVFTSLLRKDDDWQHAEIGLLKEAEQEFRSTNIHYDYGVSYQRYPIEMTTVHLQVYLFRIIK